MSQNYASAGAQTLVEEGIWTSTLEASTTNPSVTYTAQDGLYLKIGRLVTIWWSIQLATVSTQGSGIYQIAGMPFAFSSDFPTDITIGSADYFSSGNNAQVVRRHGAETVLISMIYDSDGDGDSEPMANTTETLAASDFLRGVVSYLTDG